MHYYSFNIADYRKDTGHLSILEHGIYRQLIDMYYLEEGPLPPKDQLVRLLCVRTADEEQALCSVLTDFFEQLDDGQFVNKRCDKELAAIFSKSEKARNAAKQRWKNYQEKQQGNADAMRTHNGRNADGMLPNTQHPLPINPKDQNKGAKARQKFTPPSVEDVREYCRERGNNVDPQKFVDHYEANGWMRGKTKIKSWKACVRTWEGNEKPKDDDYRGAI